MPRDLEIVDRLKRWNIPYVEVDGWRTRGSSSFDPLLFLFHHTAGAASGNAPSLNICINGRSDLPGPLCQVFLARDLVCYVIAAGRANHGGRGSWRGISGNSRAWGLETENRGDQRERWNLASLEMQCRIAAALMEGRSSPIYACRHAEYATPAGRKPDIHLHDGPVVPDGAWLRAKVAELLRQGPGGPAPAPPPVPVLRKGKIMQERLEVVPSQDWVTIGWQTNEGFKLGKDVIHCALVVVADEDDTKFSLMESGNVPRENQRPLAKAGNYAAFSDPKIWGPWRLRCDQGKVTVFVREILHAPA